MTYYIPAYQTLTITQPLSVGTNIEFLNDTAIDGVVIFERGAIGVDTAVSHGTYSSSAYFGGTILNFLPGAYYGAGGLQDQASLQVIESLFNEMDVASTATADNADFAGQITYAAQTGNQIIIADGTAAWTANTPFTLNANEAQIIEDIAIGLFGTNVNTATLDLAFDLRTNPNSNRPFIDGVFTAFTGVNETATNPCFAAGTRILTPRGEVPVEELKEGDLVITHEGEEQPIVWIGVRRVHNIHKFNRPEAVRPIIIEAGALADHMPARTLALSPDHALLLDGMLVPAKELINWSSIRQDHSVTHISYYHLELPRHGIVFAESTPTESYLCTGHRGAFDNDDSICVDHPSVMQQRREAEACAPFCPPGPKLDAIRARIAARLVGVRLTAG